jgi:hypothetical protein
MTTTTLFFQAKASLMVLFLIGKVMKYTASVADLQGEVVNRLLKNMWFCQCFEDFSAAVSALGRDPAARAQERLCQRDCPGALEARKGKYC